MFVIMIQTYLILVIEITILMTTKSIGLFENSLFLTVRPLGPQMPFDPWNRHTQLKYTLGI